MQASLKIDHLHCKRCSLYASNTIYNKVATLFLQKVQVSLKIGVHTIKVVPFTIVIDMYILHVTIRICSFGFMIFVNMNDKVASFL